MPLTKISCNTICSRAYTIKYVCYGTAVTYGPLKWSTIKNGKLKWRKLSLKKNTKQICTQIHNKLKIKATCAQWKKFVVLLYDTEYPNIIYVSMPTQYVSDLGTPTLSTPIDKRLVRETKSRIRTERALAGGALFGKVAAGTVGGAAFGGTIAYAIKRYNE